MTLAIGDGANDIGMILASHVGVGVSGREGLQAARISDYSFAQFRFLQKLLFVHGRWNYLRTGQYILATFWKEILFYLVQAHYQRFTGYSGTSLYENWSLTVFNVLFTSLAVIIPGIFEKDLTADTLLAVPELYTFGQRGLGFNYWQYLGWAVMATMGSVIIFYPVWAIYEETLFTSDTSLYAMGSVCFTVAVVFINIKLFILETHAKTLVIFGGFALSVAGWFVWMCILSQTYNPAIGIYAVRDAFLHNFGPTLSWWVIILLELAALLVLDLAVQSVRRVYFPTDVDLMQRIEKDVAKERRRKAISGEKGQGEGLELEQMAGVASVDVAPQKQQGDSGQGQGEWRCNPDYYFEHVDAKQQQQQQQPKPTAYQQQAGGMNFSRPLSAAPPRRD